MQESITALKRMFLLNDDSISHVKITANDDDKSILRKVYAYDSNVLADNDAKMKKELDKIKFLLGINLIPGSSGDTAIFDSFNMPVFEEASKKTL